MPNILSGARLVAAPYVFVLLWTHAWTTALVWFAIIGATDGFDGYIARRFHATSRLGAYLDPVADKVLLSGAFLTMGIDGVIPPWLAGLVLGRDAAILLIAIGVLLFTRSARDFPPSTAGKVSTLVQIVYILTLVAAQAGFFPVQIATACGWVVLLATAWSSVDYARRGLAMGGQ